MYLFYCITGLEFFLFFVVNEVRELESALGLGAEIPRKYYAGIKNKNLFDLNECKR